MIGQTLGHYRILEEIGAGGMGVVYRARDERLDRDVALKVLPPGALGDEAARKRFRKEALALSQLNHPNIATIYDFDTQGGADFLVMEYLPGGNLASRLSAGPLSEKEIPVLGGQIASALEEAHEKGIVHRDLKPSNIMVSPKGQAKVLDFGLARVLRPGGEFGATASLTDSHSAAGTYPYMSPEQLQGDAVDRRADIYALGVVLYEMATGQLPFREELAPRLTDAILHRVPVAPRALNARVSPELERIILKCLEKDPENRFQSAKEVGVDLRRLTTSSSLTAAIPVSRPAPRSRWVVWAGAGVVVLAVVLVALNVGGLRQRFFGGGAPGKIEAIAVLPLQNLSGDPEQEYFAEGMTDALITELAQVSALRVISRTSVMQYKNARKPLPVIAKELNVDAVVEGSVQRSGNRVRVTVQLIQASTDRHLWAKTYERDLSDIFSLESDFARAIADEVRVQLTPREQAHLVGGRPVNPEALEAYLKGRHYLDSPTEEGLKKGVEYFERAIQLDPNYAPAYAGLAAAYANLGGVGGFLPPTELRTKAGETVIKALQLDDNLAEGHALLGDVKLSFEWDWSAAEQEYRRAIALNPNYPQAHQGYGTFLEAFGRFDEAIAERNLARQLDPLSVSRTDDVGYPLYYAGQYDAARQYFRKALELDPSHFWSYLHIGQTYLEEKRYDEAIREIQKGVDLSGGNVRALATLGYAFAVAGKKREAERVLEELKARSKQAYVSPYFIAVLYAGLGEKNQAFEWLEKAYRERHPYLVLLKVEPVFKNLRTDPRFSDLLRRIGLAPR